MNIRHALLGDIQQLESLMNIAYRENHSKSWTTEHHIVRGNQINVSQLSQLLQKKDFHLYVMESVHAQIMGCIGIQIKGGAVKLVILQFIQMSKLRALEKNYCNLQNSKRC